MRKLILPFFFVFMVNTTEAQVLVNLQTINALPAALNESSGLVYLGNGILLSHNDGGPDNALYLLDTSANLINMVYVSNALNIDWEEVTTDDVGNLYVGDFGNNFNNRTDLKILKIPNPMLAINDTVEAAYIYFNFSDQVQFPPPDSLLNYDCEAFIWKDDSLFLFTKNRTVPFDGYTRCYALPDDSGTYTATYNNKLFCGSGPKEAYWITGSAIDPANDEIVLLSSGRCWLLKNYSGNDFFSGSISEIDLQNFSQKEGVATTGNRMFFFSDEKIFGLGGNLYKADFNSLVAGNAELEMNHPLFFNCNGITLEIPNLQVDLPAKISLISAHGILLHTDMINQLPVSIVISNLASGIYILQVSSRTAFYTYRFIK